MTATKEEIKIALEILKAVAEAIKALGSIPSGHLYARVMNKLTLTQYNLVIDQLKKTGVIEEKSHMLIWIGN